VRQGVAIIALASLMGCGYYVHQPGSNRYSLVLDQQAVVLERRRDSPLQDDSAHPEPNDLLRQATFDLLQGMTPDQAVAFLSDDGFVCQQLTCRTEVIEHLGWGSVPIARPGYLGHHDYYLITVPEGTIREAEDINATFRKIIILRPQ
jgi:hypothetical protein